jgi:hypothetical protein
MLASLSTERTLYVGPFRDGFQRHVTFSHTHTDSVLEKAVQTWTLERLGVELSPICSIVQQVQADNSSLLLRSELRWLSRREILKGLTVIELLEVHRFLQDWLWTISTFCHIYQINLISWSDQTTLIQVQIQLFFRSFTKFHDERKMTICKLFCESDSIEIFDNMWIRKEVIVNSKSKHLNPLEDNFKSGSPYQNLSQQEWIFKSTCSYILWEEKSPLCRIPLPAKHALKLCFKYCLFQISEFISEMIIQNSRRKPQM